MLPAGADARCRLCDLWVIHAVRQCTETHRADHGCLGAQSRPTAATQQAGATCAPAGLLEQPGLEYTARQLDPKYAVAEQTFVAANSNVRLEAFENYIRGLVELEDAERIKHLKESVRLSPNFYAASLALGRAYFAHQDYELAYTTLGKLPKNDSHALEAQFYRGLALFYTGNYGKAEDAFAFVAAMLPLPEVVNNQGVAASRHGRDGAPQFEQAISVDPKDADYHFNLAVSLRHRNDLAGAAKEIDLAAQAPPQ